MKKYKLAVWEEISGYIEVLAESDEDAREKAEDLMNAYGVEKIFYPNLNDMGSIVCEELKKYNSKHTHGMREVIECEEIPT